MLTQHITGGKIYQHASRRSDARSSLKTEQELDKNRHTLTNERQHFMLRNLEQKDLSKTSQSNEEFDPGSG